jgi:hypothetical protein
MEYILLELNQLRAHVSRCIVSACAPACGAWVQKLALPGEEQKAEKREG